jgi:transposase
MNMVDNLLNFDYTKKKLSIPKKNKLIASGSVISFDDMQKINKKLLTSVKFSIAPNEIPTVFNNKYPTVENQNFFDIKYLKKTSESVKWFLRKDLDS